MKTVAIRRDLPSIPVEPVSPLGMIPCNELFCVQRQAIEAVNYLTDLYRQKTIELKLYHCDIFDSTCLRNHSTSPRHIRKAKEDQMAVSRHVSSATVGR